MCGRIALYSEPDHLARIFDALLGSDVDPSGRPSWNVPPTRSILGVADVPDTSRRLAVVADGFYEWKPGPGKTRQPYYFTRADRQPLALAGLWEQWWGGPGAADEPEGERPAMRTCTVITTEAGPDMGDIHHRMPVVLDPAVLDEWLDPANRDKPELESLLVASPAGTLVHRRVARTVGNVRNDGPELIEAEPGESTLTQPDLIEPELIQPTLDD